MRGEGIEAEALGNVPDLFEGRFQGIVLPTEPRERLGKMMGGAAPEA